jgi:hypothetical protein
MRVRDIENPVGAYGVRTYQLEAGILSKIGGGEVHAKWLRPF